MNSKSLLYLLQNPATIEKEQIVALQQLIKEFPYFQSARSILLKGLKDQGSFIYNKELKTTAAYTTDRSVLFEFITSPSFLATVTNNSNEPTSTAQYLNTITVNDSKTESTEDAITIDQAVSMNSDEAEEVLDPQLFEAKDKESDTTPLEISPSKESSESKTNKQAEPTVSSIHPDEPLEFTKKETHSFAEWLKLTSVQPIRRDDKLKDEENDKKEISLKEKVKATPSESKPSKLQKKFEIIDQFIANNPKIKPVDKSVPTRNIAKEHATAPDELMTETLARVYLSQKNYKKAIQAYKILILKNPEKSGFFADQIRAIKKLQENK
ncbi:hypothetical protein ACE939_14990 [Aquimarina sp. W85]|uniref:hypothetical protein n=1 Tax=Aquimarina rhodophyticola TaxID=3342246 RepID=UPI00366E974B